MSTLFCNQLNSLETSKLFGFSLKSLITSLLRFTGLKLLKSFPKTGLFGLLLKSFTRKSCFRASQTNFELPPNSRSKRQFRKRDFSLFGAPPPKLCLPPDPWSCFSTDPPPSSWSSICPAPPDYSSDPPLCFRTGCRDLARFSAICPRFSKLFPALFVGSAEAFQTLCCRWLKGIRAGGWKARPKGRTGASLCILFVLVNIYKKI